MFLGGGQSNINISMLHEILLFNNWRDYKFYVVFYGNAVWNLFCSAGIWFHVPDDNKMCIQPQKPICEMCCLCSRNIASRWLKSSTNTVYYVNVLNQEIIVINEKTGFYKQIETTMIMELFMPPVFFCYIISVFGNWSLSLLTTT